MQIIATFVGLQAAGFFFFHGRLESERDKDETLHEIYDEIKKQYYRRFKTLFTITAFSIITGFLVLYATATGIELQSTLSMMPYLRQLFIILLIDFGVIVIKIKYAVEAIQLSPDKSGAFLKCTRPSIHTQKYLSLPLKPSGFQIKNKIRTR